MNLEEKCDRSIFEHEKLLIRFAYHNAALKFGLIPNDQKVKQNSKNPIPKYINKNTDQSRTSVNSINSINSIKSPHLVGQLRWYKNSDSKWVPMDSSKIRVKDHVDYCFLNQQETNLRRSSSDSILFNLKDDYQESTLSQSLTSIVDSQLTIQ